MTQPPMQIVLPATLQAMPSPTDQLVLAEGTLLPAGMVLAFALPLLAFLVHHTASVIRSDEPHSRKRIRACNGVVMLLSVTLIALGIGVLDPDRQIAAWMLCWMAAFALVWFSMVLAGLDAANTYRLAQIRRRALQQRLSAALDETRTLGRISPDHRAGA
jgi:hypothetical protein